MGATANIPAWGAMLNGAEAAAYIGLSEGKFRRAVKAGKAPEHHVRILAVSLWRRQDLDNYFGLNEAAGAPEEGKGNNPCDRLLGDLAKGRKQP